MTQDLSIKSIFAHMAAGFIVGFLAFVIFQMRWKQNKPKITIPSPSPTQEVKSIIIPTQTPTQPVSPTVVQGKVLYVSPQGSDTIQKAIDQAYPGDTIYLTAGVYSQDVVTRRDGLPGKPITITGPKEAVVKGGGRARVFELNHDYIILSGFTIDGLHGNQNKSSGYRDKLIYAVGKSAKKGPNNLKILSMTLKNAGGECIRLRYFSSNNEIGYNTILRCGFFDFEFSAGGKNGEGIYIGTAPEQLKNKINPTADIDQSNNNLIHHNTIDTQGNECVDIKEGSFGNMVEYNSCTGQQDKDSGGLDARGSGNTFRYNKIFGNVGAGVRLGGDKKEDGINNNVYKNTITNNQNGGIKFQREPQGVICGNMMEDNVDGDSVGSDGELFDPKKECETSL